jgi:hypothetical protein
VVEKKESSQFGYRALVIYLMIFFIIIQQDEKNPLNPCHQRSIFHLESYRFFESSSESLNTTIIQFNSIIHN